MLEFWHVKVVVATLAEGTDLVSFECGFVTVVKC